MSYCIIPFFTFYDCIILLCKKKKNSEWQTGVSRVGSLLLLVLKPPKNLPKY